MGVNANRRAQVPQFLHGWLSDFVRGEEEFRSRQFSPAELRRIARWHGFTSWSDYEAMLQHTGRVLRAMCEDQRFLRTWRTIQQKTGHSVTDQNGDLPARLLRHVSDWHQIRKLTKGERWRHLAQIKRAARDLQRRIAALDNGAAFTTFHHLPRYKQPMATFIEYFDLHKFQLPRFAAKRQLCAKDAKWRFKLMVDGYIRDRLIPSVTEFLDQIVTAADDYEAVAPRLPRKIRGRTALKAFLIPRIYCDLRHVFQSPPADVIADVVEVIANVGCSEDDVRKALGPVRQRERVERDAAVLRMKALGREEKNIPSVKRTNLPSSRSG